ncbi:unnamed protein product [Blepharisma stoltei]|uniref:Uncharacterized protein n=1 Tax=Blepharisma stoltei TaxID=1481888 RepID=A0AAU9JXX0_9CILI|nr:unnamed protein product [Blepharisma stoltei]
MLNSGRPHSKSLYYRGDGTGRDTYIAHDNGGLYRPLNTMPEFPIGSLMGKRKTRVVTPTTPCRTVRYKSNGTGRDGYIADTAGGFERGACSDRNFKFEGNLRSYLIHSNTYSDFWMNSKQKSDFQKRYFRQKKSIERLSKPKSYNL